MGEPSGVLPGTAAVYCGTLSHQAPQERQARFEEAYEAAKRANSRPSMFLLSKAAAVISADWLLRLQNGPGGQQCAIAPGQASVLAAEARGYSQLAAECAWFGLSQHSALCGAYYAEVVRVLGTVDPGEARARLLMLPKALQLAAERRRLRNDLPPAALGAEGGNLGQCLLEFMVRVRARGLLLATAIATTLQYQWCVCVRQQLSMLALRRCWRFSLPPSRPG